MADKSITSFNVDVIEVRIDVDIPYANGNGSYKGTSITYRDSKGTPFSKAIPTAALQGRTELLEKLSELAEQPRRVALVLQTKESGGRKFKNIIDITEPTEENTLPSTTTTTTGGNMTTTTSKTSAEVARIARQNALEAAVQVTKTADEALKVADAFAAFILAPLGVDSKGNSIEQD